MSWKMIPISLTVIRYDKRTHSLWIRNVCVCKCARQIPLRFWALACSINLPERSWLVLLCKLSASTHIRQDSCLSCTDLRQTHTYAHTHTVCSFFLCLSVPTNNLFLQACWWTDQLLQNTDTSGLSWWPHAPAGLHTHTHTQRHACCIILQGSFSIPTPLLFPVKSDVCIVCVHAQCLYVSVVSRAGQRDWVRVICVNEARLCKRSCDDVT